MKLIYMKCTLDLFTDEQLKELNLVGFMKQTSDKVFYFELVDENITPES